MGRISGILDGRRYVLVTYGEPHPREAATRIAAAAGEPLVVIDDVSPNPDFVGLAKSCARLGVLTELPEAIVALGGGASAAIDQFEHGRFVLLR